MKIKWPTEDWTNLRRFVQSKLLFREGGFYVINVTDKTIEASADEIIKRRQHIKQTSPGKGDVFG